MIKKMIALGLLAFWIFPSIATAFEREQDMPKMVNLEKDVVMHYMRGRMLFRDSNYEEARQEFLKVIEMYGEYKPAYIYLDRIQNIELEKQQEEAKKYEHIESVLEKTAEKVDQSRAPTDEDLFYQLTESEQKKVDAYIGQNEFKNMITEQRLAVLNKASNIKQDIDKVLSETRKDDVMETVKGERQPFLLRGFEEKLKEATEQDKVQRVVDEQVDMDSSFYFNRKQKIEESYRRGIMYFKQKEYFTAKKYFEEVLKLEPSYKYVQDYYESCKAELILGEIRNRNQEKMNRLLANQKEGRLQEPIEIISENKVLKESEDIADEMNMSFQQRQGALLSGHKKELIKMGIHAYKQQDYTKSLEIFEQILRFDANDAIAKKYRQKNLKVLDEREEALIEAFHVAKQISVFENMETDTGKDELSQKADQAQAVLASPEDKADQLYEHAKELYRKKEYQRALALFREVELLNPNHKFVPKYIAKIKEFLNQESTGTEEVDKSPDELYEEGVLLYKRQAYKAAARKFWHALRLNPYHAKAQKLLAKCSARIDENLEKTFEAEEDGIIVAHGGVMNTDARPRALTAEERREAEDLYEKAKHFYRSGSFKQATELFEKVAQLLPEDEYVGRYLQRSQEKYAEQAQVKDAGVDDVYEQAKALYRDGRYAAAYPLFQQVVQMDPSNRYAPRYLERTREAMEQSGERTPQKAAPVEDRNSFDQMYEQGKKLYREGKYQEAIPYFEQSIKLDPTHRYAPRYLERSQERSQGAAPAASEPVASSPATPASDFAAIYEQGKKLYRQGNYAEAIPYFEQAIALDPNHQYAPKYLERSQERLQDSMKTAPSESAAAAPAQDASTEGSINEFNQAYEEGKRLYREGRYQESIPYFERSVQLDSSHRYAPRYLERAKERVQEAGGTVAQAESPAQPVVQQSTAPAQPAARPASAEVSGNFDTIYEQGKVLYREGRYAEAIPYFEKAVQMDASHRYAPRYLQRSQERLAEINTQQTTEVKGPQTALAPISSPKVQNVNQAIPQVDNFVQAYQEGKEYFKQREYEKAIPYFQRALELDSEHPYAKRYLEKSKEKAGIEESPEQVSASDMIESEQAPAQTQVEAAPMETYDVNKAAQLYEEGKLYYRDQKYREALPYFEQAVRLDPAHRYASKYLERVRSMLNIDGSETQEVAKESEADLLLRKERQKVMDRELAQEEARKQRQMEKEMQKVKKLSQKYYQKGKEMYRRRQYVQAAELFEQSLKVYPQNRYAKRYLERTVDIMKTMGSAGESYEERSLVADHVQQIVRGQIVSSEEVSGDDGVGQSEEMSEKEEFDALKESNAKIAEISSDYYEKGKNSYKEKNYQQALEAFEKAYLIDPSNKYAERFLERTKVKIEEITVAEKTKEEEKKSKQESLEKLYERAMTALQAEQWGEAITLLEALQVKDAAFKDVSSKLVMARKKEYEKLKQSIGGVVGDLYKQAIQLYREKKYDQAAPLFEKIAHLLPKDRFAGRYLQNIYERMEDAEKHTQSLFKEAKKLYYQGQLQDAFVQLEQVLKLNPNHQEAAQLYEEVYQKLKEEGIDVNKNGNIAYLYQQGDALLANQQFKESIAHYDQLIQMFLDENNISLAAESEEKDVAAGEEQMDDTKKALEAKKQELRSQRYYEKGKILYQKRLYVKAHEAFQDALKLNPNHKYAQRYLEKVEKRLEDMQKSILKQKETIAPAQAEESLPTKAEQKAAPVRKEEVAPVQEQVIPAKVEQQAVPVKKEEVAPVQEQVLPAKAEQKAVPVKKEKVAPVQEAVVVVPEPVKPAPNKEKSAKVKVEETKPVQEEKSSDKMSDQLQDGAKIEMTVREKSLLKRLIKKAEIAEQQGYYEEALSVYSQVAKEFPFYKNAEQEMLRLTDKVVQSQIKRKQVIRQLIREGEKLQKEGKNSEALEKFKEAATIEKQQSNAMLFVSQLEEPKQHQIIKEVVVKTEGTDLPKTKAPALEPVVKEALVMPAPKAIDVQPAPVAYPQVERVVSKPAAQERSISTTTADSEKEIYSPENKNQAEQLYEKGKSLYRSKEYEQALLMFEEVIELDPSHRYASRYRDRLLEMGLTSATPAASSPELKQAAPEQAKVVAQVPPTQPEPQKTEPTDTAQAEKKNDQDGVEKLYEEAKEAYRARDYQKAKTMFEQVLKSNPSFGNTPKYLDRAEYLMGKNQVEALLSQVQTSGRATSQQAREQLSAYEHVKEQLEAIEALLQGQKYEEALLIAQSIAEKTKNNEKVQEVLVLIKEMIINNNNYKNNLKQIEEIKENEAKIEKNTYNQEKYQKIDRLIANGQQMYDTGQNQKSLLLFKQAWALSSGEYRVEEIQKYLEANYGILQTEKTTDHAA